jgi:hypothetical protein
VLQEEHEAEGGVPTQHPRLRHPEINQFERARPEKSGKNNERGWPEDPGRKPRNAGATDTQTTTSASWVAPELLKNAPPHNTLRSVEL